MSYRCGRGEVSQLLGRVRASLAHVPSLMERAVASGISRSGLFADDPSPAPAAGETIAYEDVLETKERAVAGGRQGAPQVVYIFAAVATPESGNAGRSDRSRNRILFPTLCMILVILALGGTVLVLRRFAGATFSDLDNGGSVVSAIAAVAALVWTVAFAMSNRTD